jgi:hypothetical protein
MKDRISRSFEYDRERRNDRLWQKTLKTMAVRKEIMRLGHSIGYGKKETVHSRDFWKRYCIKTTLTEHIRALSMIKSEKNITGKKDSRYGAMENVSINLCIRKK